MPVIQVNPNFHVTTEGSILEKDDPIFKEYRRKWAEWPKSFTVGDFPLHLDVEASRICNLQCAFCATSYEPLGGKGFMSCDTFKKIIDEGAEHGLCAIKFNSGARGEPLLNKSLIEMVAYAKGKGIMDVYFNTNALLLTRDASSKLIEAGLDRISISFEGTTAEVYEKYRIGSSYKRVLNNVKELIELRNEMNSRKPLVRVQTVAIPELIPKMKEYTKFWEKIADEVAFIDFKDYSHRQDILIYDWACPYIWQRLMVTWDGKISICGFDYSTKHNLGNVKNTTIHSAWKGDVMEEIRKKHKEGRSHEIPVCDSCAFRTTEILKLKEQHE